MMPTDHFISVTILHQHDITIVIFFAALLASITDLFRHADY